MKLTNKLCLTLFILLSATGTHAFFTRVRDTSKIYFQNNVGEKINLNFVYRVGTDQREKSLHLRPTEWDKKKFPSSSKIVSVTVTKEKDPQQKRLYYHNNVDHKFKLHQSYEVTVDVGNNIVILNEW